MSLIEVLASILIFSIGILGLVALQTKATQISLGAEDRNRAAALANEAVSLMWTNHSGNLPAVSPSSVYTSWVAKVAANSASGLPSGVGSVTYDSSAGTSTVLIQWQEPSKGAAQNQYTTVVVIN